MFTKPVAARRQYLISRTKITMNYNELLIKKFVLIRSNSFNLCLKTRRRKATNYRLNHAEVPQGVCDAVVVNGVGDVIRVVLDAGH